MWLYLLAHLAVAQDAGPTVVTVDEPVDVDGFLTEEAWENAEPVTDFVRFQPTAGDAAPGTTEVRFLQDERYLYVGIRITGSETPIRARVSPRERINDDDQVGVYFDTFHDARSGYIFYLNPLGIQQDLRTSNGAWNGSWDTAFRSRGHVTEDGYELEIAYPWRSLKYPSVDGPQDWGVIITRKIPAEGAKYAYPELEAGHPRLFSQAATLQNVQPSSSGSGLELIPALTAAQAWPREDGSIDGFDRWDEVLRPSLDLRYGITPDVSVTATANPDFSQVEGDVSDVRVNPRFAFQFPETRPFFLDGFEYYEDRTRSLYTRSINAPISGVKVSGREGPVSLGVLNAIDRAPLASFHSEGTPGFNAEDVDGRMASNTAVRARIDAFDAGFVGVSFADKRLLGAGDDATSVGAGVFDAGGLDAEIPLGGRWITGGSTHHSLVGIAGESGAWGMVNAASLSRATGVGTGFGISGRDITPGYRNELGFTPQSGITTANTFLNHTFAPDSIIDAVVPSLSVDVAEERDGDHLYFANASNDIQMAGTHNVEVEGGIGDQIEQGVQTRIWFAKFDYDADWGPLFKLNPSVTRSVVLDYTALVPADAIQVEWDSSLRPTAGIRLDTRASWERVDPRANGPIGRAASAHLVRNRLSWQFSRELGLRVVGEYTNGSDFDQQLRSSALLTWFKVPGTAAYLGYSETTNLAVGDVVDRGVFAKISVLLRP